jgi:hypothetical protein
MLRFDVHIELDPLYLSPVTAHQALVILIAMGASALTVARSTTIFENRSGDLTYQLNLLESALTKNTPVTPSESALTKSLNLKSCRIRTHEKRRGEGATSSQDGSTRTLLANTSPLRQATALSKELS